MAQIESISYSVPADIAMMMNKLCECIEEDIVKQCGSLPSEVMIRLVGDIIKSYGESIIEVADESEGPDESIN
jgi:hypothetical protein